MVYFQSKYPNFGTFVSKELTKELKSFQKSLSQYHDRELQRQRGKT
jgi:hypothetical protein